MSQHWHDHWAEDTFAPKRLRNWEIPKQHSSWPSKHCRTTKFIADNNGHILDCVKKAKHSPWGAYKGTWDLPRKITRSIVEELSTIHQHKNEASKFQKWKHLNLDSKVKQAQEKETTEDIGSPKHTTNKIQIEFRSRNIKC